MVGIFEEFLVWLGVKWIKLKVTMSERATNELNEEETTVETNWDEVVTSFDDMDLKEDLLRGIYAYGFEKPSAIQQVSDHWCWLNWLMVNELIELIVESC